MAPVRLKDVAQRAGVSIMTVSKVLRNEPDVSAATRTRIRALAEEMGYVPDALAQSLRTRSARLVGIVIPAITNPIFARLLLAVEERVHERGFDLLFSHTLNQPEREEAMIRRMIARRVNGLILFPVHRFGTKLAIAEEVRRRALPTVILGPPPAAWAGTPSVQVDDVQGGYVAAKHLLDRGHHRIAFLAGPPAAVWSQERLEGHQRALREAGVELDDRLVFQAGGTIEEGAKAALQMLQENVDATALQAVNDLVAIGAADLLLNLGLRIPEDVSVVGFGNILTSSYFRTPLTTVRQPKFSMGTAAMEILESLWRGERPESRRLPPALLIRSSTARPPLESKLSAIHPPQPPNEGDQP